MSNDFELTIFLYLILKIPMLLGEFLFWWGLKKTVLKKIQFDYFGLTMLGFISRVIIIALLNVLTPTLSSHFYFLFFTAIPFLIGVSVEYLYIMKNSQLLKRNIIIYIIIIQLLSSFYNLIPDLLGQLH